MAAAQHPTVRSGDTGQHQQHSSTTQQLGDMCMQGRWDMCENLV